MRRSYLIAHTRGGKKYFAEERYDFDHLLWLSISRNDDGLIEKAQFVKPYHHCELKGIGIFFKNGFLCLKSCYIKKPFVFETFDQWLKFHKEKVGLMEVEELFLYQVILSMKDSIKCGTNKNNHKEVEDLFKTLRSMLEPKFDFMKTEDWIEKIQNLNETLIAADSGNEETFMELLDLQYEGIKLSIAARHNELSEEGMENLKSAQEKINHLLNYFTSSN
ncbi:MAG: hypothetical protein N4A44_00850 [Alphaproteobacteria bacterium]|jgi:hypothetical protein|nr:hypothetical protein [Alphaproteobacteria bacterium]